MTAATAKVVRVPKCWSTTPPSADPPAIPVWVPPDSQPNASTAPAAGASFPAKLYMAPRGGDEPEPGEEDQRVEEGDVRSRYDQEQPDARRSERPHEAGLARCIYPCAGAQAAGDSAEAPNGQQKPRLARGLVRSGKTHNSDLDHGAAKNEQQADQHQREEGRAVRRGRLRAEPEPRGTHRRVEGHGQRADEAEDGACDQRCRRAGERAQQGHQRWAGHKGQFLQRGVNRIKGVAGASLDQTGPQGADCRAHRGFARAG